MVGRPPKPTAVKKLNGNPGGRPLNQNEPTAKPGEPAMPKGMPTAARAKWKETVPLLLDMNVLTEADGDALAAFCMAYADYKEAQKVLKKDGKFYSTDSGIKRPHPMLAVRDKAVVVMTRFMTEFGMTPASRSRIHTTPKPKQEADPFDALINRKAGSALPLSN